MEAEAKCYTNGTKKYKQYHYIEYVHKPLKCSIGLAYKRRLITVIRKKPTKNSIIWKCYFLHNASIIIVSSCRLNSCVSPIESSETNLTSSLIAVAVHTISKFTVLLTQVSILLVRK